MWILIANSSGGGIAGTLDSSYYKGQGKRQGIEREFLVVQEKTGTLSPGAHAGSYNGQDAYNDMLVTDIRNAADRRVQEIGTSEFPERERLQGFNRPDFEGGRTMNKVRRLTPTECELLQGFPKGWTDIGDWTDSNGKARKCSDSARYKALGNSICTPYWFNLMRKISAQYERPATLGSLFDGIGGFPYCWERCNGEGSAVWASEIDDFCVAVTKKRFGKEAKNEQIH